MLVISSVFSFMHSQISLKPRPKRDKLLFSFPAKVLATPSPIHLYLTCCPLNFAVRFNELCSVESGIAELPPGVMFSSLCDKRAQPKPHIELIEENS